MSDADQRPRLVYDARAAADTAPAAGDRPAGGRRTRLLVAALLLAIALVAAAQYRRAAVLEARVGELTTALAAAQGEIEARRAQLDAIRASVAEVRERLVALEALAATEPGTPRASTPVPAEAPQPAR